MSEEILKEDNKYQNIEYKKNNPFIFKNLSSNKKFHKFYNLIKFTICILVFIFALLSLWYATQWKDNTLTNLKINLESKYNINGYIWDISWTDQIAKANELGMSSWSSSSLDNGMVGALIAISFIGLVLMIPSLVFKNGTIFSVASISLAFVSLIIIIVFFSIGASSQNQVAMIYSQSDITSLNNKVGTLKNEIASIQERIDLLKESDPMTDEINKEILKLESEITNINKEIASIRENIQSIIDKEVPQILSKIF